MILLLLTSSPAWRIRVRGLRRTEVRGQMIIVATKGRKDLLGLQRHLLDTPGLDLGAEIRQPPA
jgi:hypothetical protein